MKLSHFDGGMSNQEIRIAEKKQGDSSKPFIGKESFPCILYTMLDEVDSHGLAHIVSWQPHGRCFVVHKRKAFIEYILPVYFRMSKFPSFQRQLNLYGFQRITTGRDKGGYYHELFLRGRKDLCKTIPRQQVKGAGPRKPAMPEAEPNFYLMDFMPPRGSEMMNMNPTVSASASELIMPSAASIHAAAVPQPTIESAWMASLYPSIFAATSTPATSSGALSAALQQQQQQQQQQQHGMMGAAIGSGAMGHGSFDSLVAALGGTGASQQHNFMRPTNPLSSPASLPAANRMPNFGGDSSLLSMLNASSLQPQLPQYDPSNATDFLRTGSRDHVSVATAAAAANLRNAPVYSQERDTGNILFDAYVAALQSEFTDQNSGPPPSTARRRPSSSDDSFRDWMSRNSSA